MELLKKSVSDAGNRRKDNSDKSLELHIAELAKNYRSEWRAKLSESAKIEEYGFNQFLDGKAGAYEDCLDLIRSYRKGL